MSAANSPYVDAQELSRSAFDLLACSSMGRYERMARQAAARTHLLDHLRSDPDLSLRVIARARSLWQQLLVAATARDSAEIEAAILLTTLASTAAPGVDGLLKEISLSEGRSVSWLSALARRLRHEGSGSTLLTFSVPGFDEVACRTTNETTAAIEWKSLDLDLRTTPAESSYMNRVSRFRGAY